MSGFYIERKNMFVRILYKCIFAYNFAPHTQPNPHAIRIHILVKIQRRPVSTPFLWDLRLGMHSGRPLLNFVIRHAY